MFRFSKKQVAATGLISASLAGVAVYASLLAAVAMLGALGAALALNSLTRRIATTSDGGPARKGRNFSGLVLGSTVAWRRYGLRQTSSGDTISFAFYKRSLAADFLVLKHRFSFVRDNGVVVISIDSRDLKTALSGRISAWDACLFHPITLNALRIDRTWLERRRRFPLVFAPIQSIRLVLARCLPLRWYSSGKSVAPELVAEAIAPLIEFCAPRGLEARVLFLRTEHRKPWANECAFALHRRFPTLRVDLADELETFTGPLGA